MALSVQVAAPPERTIAKVEFTLDGRVVATDTAAPYQFTLERFLPGTYTVGARATDSAGRTGDAPPQQITVASSETVNYLHTDLAGSPMAATDATGNVLWRESYKPYGEREIRDSRSADERQFWHGKPEEPGGLQYFGARYYHPVLGRFFGVDPKGVDEGNIHSFNRYAYGNGNPYKYRDPNGQWAEDIAFAIPSLVVGAHSLSHNVSQGNVGASLVDLVGIGVDMIAAATPGVIGGAGFAIAAVRKLGGEATGAAAANGGRGLSAHGGTFSSTTNAAGGDVVTSVGKISQNDFATYVNSGLYKGDVNIISGVHGTASGQTIPALAGC